MTLGLNALTHLNTLNNAFTGLWPITEFSEMPLQFYSRLIKSGLLARQTFHIYQAKEQVVGYGTSSPPSHNVRQRLAFLECFPYLRGKRLWLFLSRIHPKKGVDLLIDSFAAVANVDPNLHLVIAGPDQVGLQAVLQQRAAALGILIAYLAWHAQQ